MRTGCDDRGADWIEALRTEPDLEDSKSKHASRSLRESLIRVAHRSRSGEIARVQLTHPKPGCTDEFVNLAVEVATSTDTLPQRRNSFLPDSHTNIGRATMFNKNEPSIHS
jgi:hypothetical protein